MTIQFANKNNYEYVKTKDKHVEHEMLLRKIKSNEIIVAMENNKTIGWLRYNYFWDNTPFMNMLWIDESCRGQGIGKELVEFWEKEMKKSNYNLVMTSTQANEEAQHFYRKLNYKDSGSLLLENEPLEIIFVKNLK
ncbi:GNAT family N-acetyltransferase [Chengkuizengella axinellae]|uniref:GNAT family N-acetyltransferase n=1 Tax=Chengkuizengella axinellae TaxID=3064388 RepID=A0ABT9J1G9_9BACL|nr:GNAT family N-acetyltransferase [Chengkuizengella sp. 2205SS18-9]MDP5275442.1 GNAT family N-acetyltransferase [Chengkuizengella sp. 2205SS18-9]